MTQWRTSCFRTSAAQCAAKIVIDAVIIKEESNVA
jgi:hypothetical protein